MAKAPEKHKPEKHKPETRKEACKETYETDVVIVGAGPVGLFAVFTCGMQDLRCHVIDALGEIGGQCSALYPEKPIYDIPAYPEISGGQLIENLEAQIAPFQPVFHLGQQAVSLSKEGRKWRLKTCAGATILTHCVIIAAGAGVFGPNKPPLDNINSFEGRSVFYMVRRKADFSGKTIVIAGGGDSAVDWAVALSDIAAKIYLVHRRDKFRAAPDSLKKLAALEAGTGQKGGSFERVTPFQLKSLEGENGCLRAVHLVSDAGEKRRLEADILLPFYGLKTEMGPLSAWGLNCDNGRIIADPTSAATNLPGIFAIGDIVSYRDKLPLILTGFAEGAQAAQAVRRYIFPDEEKHFEYSTTKGRPAAA